MALSDQDGNTVSHLAPHHAAHERQPGAELPDRGRWVGPRPGEPLPLEKPESTLPRFEPEPETVEWARKHGFRIVSRAELDCARIDAHRQIRWLLDHQPMVEAQRRILVRAIGVLETFT